MEKIDPQKTSFQWKGMVPEAGDDVTTLWGRKLAKNLVNGYALFGTLRLMIEDTIWVNLGLSHIYTLPPSVYVLYRPNDYPAEYGLLLNDQFIKRDNPTYGPDVLVEYYKRISVCIYGDYVGMRAALGTSQYIDAFYKIHGV